MTGSRAWPRDLDSAACHPSDPGSGAEGHLRPSLADGHHTARLCPWVGLAAPGKAAATTSGPDDFHASLLGYQFSLTILEACLSPPHPSNGLLPLKTHLSHIPPLHYQPREGAGTAWVGKCRRPSLGEKVWALQEGKVESRGQEPWLSVILCLELKGGGG